MSLPSRRRLTIHQHLNFYPRAVPRDKLCPTFANWAPIQFLNSQQFKYFPGTRIMVSTIHLYKSTIQLNNSTDQLNKSTGQINKSTVQLKMSTIPRKQADNSVGHTISTQPNKLQHSKTRISTIWPLSSFHSPMSGLQQLSLTSKISSTPFSLRKNVTTRLFLRLALVINFPVDLVQGSLSRSLTKLCLSARLVFPTWMGSGAPCRLNWSLQSGILFSRTISITTSYSMVSNSEWIFPSMEIQLRETGPLIIPAPWNTWMTSTSTSPRSYSSELLLAHYQLTFHSQCLPAHLPQFQSRRPIPPEQLQIALKIPLGSMRGLMLISTEGSIGKSNSQPATQSKPTLQGKGERIQARKCCSGKWICPDTTVSSLCAQVRSLFWELLGEENFTWIVFTRLATERRVWDHKEHQMPSHGFTRLKFLQVQGFQTPGENVIAPVPVIVAVITAVLMSTILPLQPPKTMPSTSSMPCLASSKPLAYSHQPLLGTLFLHQRSPQSSVWSTTSRQILYPSLQTSWPMLSLFSKTGREKLQPRTDRSSSSLENCFIVQGWSALGGYSWDGCFRPAETQRDWMKESTWMQIFILTAGGGQKTCQTGMESPSWNSLQAGKSPWMPAAMELILSQLSEHSTLSTINTSNQKSPLRLPIGIYLTWSCTHMLSQSSCGVHLAEVCPSLVELIMKPQKSSSVLEDRKLIVAWSWVELYGLSCINTKWNGILRGYLQKKMSCLMPYQDGHLHQRGRHFGRSVGTLALFLQNELSPVTCLSGLQSDVSGVSLVEPQTDAPSVASLHQLAKEYQDKAWAKSTKASKSSEVKMFMKFCITYGISSLPVTGDDLVLYSCWLVASGHITKYGSLTQYLSAVSTHHKKLGLACVTPSQYGPLHYTCRGIRRELASPSRSARPITIKILTNLLNTEIAHSSWISAAILITMKAVCSILFFSMVRLSSLLPAYPAAADPFRQVTWGNVKKCSQGATFFVHVEKTIQFQERKHVVTLAKKPGSIFCPVMALEKLRDLRGSKNCKIDDLVFQVPVSEFVFRPLCKYEFQKWFVHRLNEMGLDPKKIRPHSFRHGGVNFALMCEENLNMVKVSSGHLSESVWTYCNLPASSRFQVATKMMKALPGSSATV